MIGESADSTNPEGDAVAESRRTIFARRLQSLMTTMGLSNAELATRLGNNPGTVSRWRTGQNLPRRGIQEQLASVLGTDRDSLMDPSPVADVIRLHRSTSRTSPPALQLDLPVQRELIEQLIRATIVGIRKGYARDESWNARVDATKTQLLSEWRTES